MTKAPTKPERLSAFGDAARQPTAAELAATLGPAAEAWDSLIAHVTGAYGPVVAQWNLASAKLGWSVRLKKGDRILLYLIPQAGRFLVGVVLGGQAVAAARAADLPAAVRRALSEAPRHAEGTGLRLPVRGADDLPAIEILTALKMKPA